MTDATKLADDQIKWRRVSEDSFEYAIQQGPHGDEFVKLLDGSYLRRSQPGTPSRDQIRELIRKHVTTDLYGCLAGTAEVADAILSLLPAVPTTDSNQALSADLEKVQTELDAATARIAELEAVPTTEPVAWSASTHDEIIKRLMAGVGMPNSTSLYVAFKQFANELYALAHAAPVAAATEGVREIAAGAIRTFCQSLGTNAVQMSHGTERIYFAGISLDALACAVALALTRPNCEAPAK